MIDVLLASIGVAPELGEEWWVLALLGVLALLLIVAIIFMFVSAFNNSKPEEESDEVEEDEPEEELEEEPDEAEDDEAEEDDDDDEDDDEESEMPIAPVAASVEYTTVYNRSFMARLSQSSVELKSRYNEIKNHILSYKKVKSRISWSFDSFNSGRNRLIKIQCKGKNLMMYMALDPTELDPKYRIKDMSEVARYQQVPSRLKVKSDRTLKYANELIDKLMANNEIVEKKEYEAVDFTVPFMETEDLIANGLIKTRETTSKPFYQ